MGHDYLAARKIVFKTILILAVITVVEVLFALLGKGYIIPGVFISGWIIGGVMIILSATKAYFIVYEFMHMKYEVPSLVKSVLLPTFLLVWAIVAFLMEGKYWNNSRAEIADKNRIEAGEESSPTGMIYQIKETDF
jgi:cytochrome c oxidase subunit IV